MLTTVFQVRGNDCLFNSFNEALIVQDAPSLRVDAIGIAQFLLFLYPLYERTFVRGVALSVRNNDGTPFRLRYQEGRQGYDTENETRLWGVLQESMRRLCADENKTYGVGNSGGMDSRVILYLLHTLGKKSAPYTLGDSPSDAVFIATKVASTLRMVNTVVPIERDFLPRYAKRVVRERSMYSTLYSWYLSGERRLPAFDVNLTGFNGDNMLGSHLTGVLSAIGNKDALYKFIYNHYRVVDDRIVRQFLRAPYRHFLDAAYEDYLNHIRSSDNTRNENIFGEFNFMCRQMRFIRNSLIFDFCGRYEWFSPFYTKEFMDLALSLTLDERFERRLYCATLKRYMGVFRNLRFAGGPLSNSDLERPIIRRVKEYLWTKGEKYGLSFFKGNHKNTIAWMEESDALDFIRECFQVPSPVFDELFQVEVILDNLSMLFSKHVHFLFNLLTVKLWIEHYDDVVTL